MHVPVGVALDRFGSRRLILTGVLTMAIAEHAAGARHRRVKTPG